MYVNESLQALDSLTAAAVEEPPRNDPPETPSVGTCFLIGTSPTGDWTGYPAALATYSAGGWRFAAPIEGMEAWVRSESVFAIYTQGTWEIGTVFGSRVLIGDTQVIGPQASPISDPSGGTVTDSEARAAISSILAALRQHGLISSQ